MPQAPLRLVLVGMLGLVLFPLQSMLGRLRLVVPANDPLVSAAAATQDGRRITIDANLLRDALAKDMASHHRKPTRRRPQRRVGPPPPQGQNAAAEAKRRQQRRRQTKEAVSAESITNASTTTNDDKKPYFILHVGPPKTGTTTLQTELTALRDELRRDNYLYAGKYFDAQKKYFDDTLEATGHAFWSFLRRTACHARSAAAQGQGRLDEQPGCLRAFAEEMEKFRKNQTSVIVSDEVFGMENTRFYLDWKSLRRTLRGWNIVVVVGYRRLADWLPSVKQQQERYRATKPLLNFWPGEGGKAPEPLFPYVLRRTHLRPTLSLATEYAGKSDDDDDDDDRAAVAVRVLNIHRASSIRSAFLCDVVPRAGRACAASRARDETAPEPVVNPEVSVAYDMLATAAAAAGLVDLRLERRHVVLAAQARQEERLGRTARDFATTCPSTADLHALLNASLAAEAETLPRFHERHRGQHEADFWKAVRAQKYCWIDTAKVLADEGWRDFFQNIPQIGPQTGNGTSAWQTVLARMKMAMAKRRKQAVRLPNDNKARVPHPPQRVAAKMRTGPRRRRGDGRPKRPQTGRIMY